MAESNVKHSYFKQFTKRFKRDKNKITAIKIIKQNPYAMLRHKYNLSIK